MEFEEKKEAYELMCHIIKIILANKIFESKHTEYYQIIALPALSGALVKLCFHLGFNQKEFNNVLNEIKEGYESILNKVNNNVT